MSIRIMIAEDEQLVLMGLRKAVEMLGYEVVGEAIDGEEAIELAVEVKPDLILMDINLPVLNGLEAARRINRCMSIPIIIVTGYSQLKLIEKAEQVGVCGYLVKPVDEDDLRPAIRMGMHAFQKTQLLEDKLKEVTQKLEDRKVIEKAKGIIQRRRNLDEDEAMRFLQKRSRDTNTRLVDVARQIIAADRLL
jgi:AmiR/NasT family two-component response regulator